MRESVKPLEKIEGIKILHYRRRQRRKCDPQCHRRSDQLGAALSRLVKEIGIEGGCLGGMTDVLRDAKDISALTRDKKGTKEKAPKQSDDDRDR